AAHLEQLPGGERVHDPLDLPLDAGGARRLEVVGDEAAELIGEEEARERHLRLSEELLEADPEAGALLAALFTDDQRAGFDRLGCALELEAHEELGPDG